MSDPVTHIPVVTNALNRDQWNAFLKRFEPTMARDATPQFAAYQLGLQLALRAVEREFVR